MVKTLVAECTAGDKHITLKGDDTQTVILSANPSALEREELRNTAGRHYNASPVKANPFDAACAIPRTSIYQNRGSIWKWTNSLPRPPPA